MKTPRTRALHLIDLENLCGCATCTSSMTATVHTKYMQNVPTSPYDHYVLATSHHNALATAAWPGGYRVVRSGKDGADIALYEHVMNLDPASRYSEIVLASGDHFFVPAAKAWKEAGLKVTVVAGHGLASRELRMTADRFVPLSLNIR